MRFLLRFLICLVAIVLVYAGVFRLVDPRADFGTGIFPPVVATDRLNKLALADKYIASDGIEGLILGSSRSQQIDPVIFQQALGTHFFNFAVSGAVLDDDLAAYRWVRDHNQHPKVVVIGLDVNALSDTDVVPPAIDKNAQLKAELSGFSSPRGAATRLRLTAQTYKSAFSWQYVEDMYRSSRAWAHKVVRGEKPIQLLFRRDGYFPFDFYPLRGDGTINEAAHVPACIANYTTIFKHMNGLGAQRIQYLEQLVSEARHDGAVVKIWITPVQPAAAQAISQFTHYATYLDQTRALLADLHARYGAEVYDLSNPQTFGSPLTGWYDCVHVNPVDDTRIVATLLQPGS